MRNGFESKASLFIRLEEPRDGPEHCFSCRGVYRSESGRVEMRWEPAFSAIVTAANPGTVVPGFLRLCCFQMSARLS